MGNKAAQANDGVDGGGHQGGGHGVDLGHDHQAQLLGFVLQAGLPFHEHGGVQALHLQVVGAGDALGDVDIAAHKVKGKTGAKDIPKIQAQAPADGLQAEHTEQPRHAGVGLEKLALVHAQAHAAGHAGPVGRGGAALPAQLPA